MYKKIISSIDIYGLFIVESKLSGKNKIKLVSADFAVRSSGFFL